MSRGFVIAPSIKDGFVRLVLGQSALSLLTLATFFLSTYVLGLKYTLAMLAVFLLVLVLYAMVCTNSKRNESERSIADQVACLTTLSAIIATFSFNSAATGTLDAIVLDIIVIVSVIYFVMSLAYMALLAKDYEMKMRWIFATSLCGMALIFGVLTGAS